MENSPIAPPYMSNTACGSAPYGSMGFMRPEATMMNAYDDSADDESSDNDAPPRPSAPSYREQQDEVLTDLGHPDNTRGCWKYLFCCLRSEANPATAPQSYGYTPI